MVLTAPLLSRNGSLPGMGSMQNGNCPSNFKPTCSAGPHRWAAPGARLEDRWLLLLHRASGNLCTLGGAEPGHTTLCGFSLTEGGHYEHRSPRSLLQPGLEGLYLPGTPQSSLPPPPPEPVGNPPPSYPPAATGGNPDLLWSCRAFPNPCSCNVSRPGYRATLRCWGETTRAGVPPSAASAL